MPPSKRKNAGGNPRDGPPGSCWHCKRLKGPYCQSEIRVQCENQNCEKYFHIACEGFDRRLDEANDIDNFFCTDCLRENSTLKVTYTARGRKLLAAIEAEAGHAKPNPIPAAVHVATSSSQSSAPARAYPSSTSILPVAPSSSPSNSPTVSSPSSGSNVCTTPCADVSALPDSQSHPRARSSADMSNDLFGAPLSDSDDDDMATDEPKNMGSSGPFGDLGLNASPAKQAADDSLDRLRSLLTRPRITEPDDGSTLPALKARKTRAALRSSAVPGPSHAADSLHEDVETQATPEETSAIGTRGVPEASPAASVQDDETEKTQVEGKEEANENLRVPITEEFLDDPAVKAEIQAVLDNNPYVSREYLISIMKNPNLQEEAWNAFNLIMEAANAHQQQ